MRNNNNIQVSVIISVYNEEKYINSCLLSLIKQSFKRVEIIVINDGSTDKSLSRISKFNNIRFFSIKHLGYGYAKNYGAKKALGQILVFLDADMRYHRDYIKKIINPILTRKSNATFTYAEKVGNYNNVWSKCWQINSGLSGKRRIDLTKKDSDLSFRAIKKSIFSKTLGFDPKWGYFDDKSLSKYKIKNIGVTDAFCYHYNPDSLLDVFYSARWMGRGLYYKFSFREVVRYSVINSSRVSIWRIWEGAPIRFIIFKVLFDFGLLYGMIFKNEKNLYSK